MLVLLIDDDDDVTDHYFEVLSSVSDTIQIVRRRTAEAARTWLKTNSPQLVVMDVHLPFGSGHTVLDQLAKQLRKPRVAIVSNVDPQTTEFTTQAYKILGAECFGKPIPDDRLRQLARQIAVLRG